MLRFTMVCHCDLQETFSASRRVVVLEALAELKECQTLMSRYVSEMRRGLDGDLYWKEYEVASEEFEKLKRKAAVAIARLSQPGS